MAGLRGPWRSEVEPSGEDVHSARRYISGLRGAFAPRIRPLSDRTWKKRHNFVLAVVGAHVLAISLSVLDRSPTEEAVATAVMPAIPALVALLVRGRRPKEVAATVALLVSAGLVFHDTGGTAMSFVHLFAVVCVLSVYRDWYPFGVTVLAVVAHDGLIAWVVGDGPLFLGLPLAEYWSAVILLGLLLGFGAAFMTVAVVTERERQRAENYYLRQGRWALTHQLELAERFKEDLLAIVSHELRTPLTAIAGFTHTLLDREEDIDSTMRREMLRRILGNSGRLDRVVQNLLEAGGRWRVDESVATDVDTVVTLIVREMEHARVEETERRPIRILGLPSGAHVAMGEEALDLVVSNLVDNAVKFAKPSTEVVVSIRGRVDRLLPGGSRDAVVVRVTNEADPISEEERQRIFEPFVQLDSSSRRRHPGVGLGLYVVRQVVEGHGGTIQLDCGPSTVSIEAALPSRELAKPDEGPRPPVPLAIEAPDTDHVTSAAS